MRRRFNDTGDDLVKCYGCGTQRLPCWMEYTNSFYGRVQRIFDVLDVNGDGKLSHEELLSLSKKTGENLAVELSRTLEGDFDIEELCTFYHSLDASPHINPPTPQAKREACQTNVVSHYPSFACYFHPPQAPLRTRILRNAALRNLPG